MKLDPDYIDHLVQEALAEDIGSGDATVHLIPEQSVCQATILTREPMVVCGQLFVEAVWQKVDASIECEWLVSEGANVAANTVLCQLKGSARSLLTAERTALNFLQFLSGTATTTAEYVAKIQHTTCQLLDTRKTIPGLRLAQKYAVHCGGGVNHRIGLFDAFLIKENHIMAAGSIAAAVSAARAYQPALMLEVEVETMDELQQAVDAQVDRIMLDNFSLADMRKAVAFVDGKIALEASGNVSLETIAGIAETGVNFISVGAITKHVQAIDLSMRLVQG